jgi:hypothetical protein
MDIRSGDLVIGRYSVLPYYQEQDRDIRSVGAGLINSYQEHRAIADIASWYHLLEDITPKTWFRVSDLPRDESGPFVLKGETNSRKFLWSTHMFAPTRDDVSRVHSKLLDDSLIGQQNIYIRQYIQFEPVLDQEYSINDLPITVEFRVFVAYGQILSVGYYWASHVYDILDSGNDVPDPEMIPSEFLDDITTRLSDIPFYAVDVARDVDGKWWVVEINDGQMSGLSMNEPGVLYPALWDAVHYRHTRKKP